MLELSEKQHAALTALLSGKRVPEAAREAGVDETTVRRWLRKDAAFQESLADGRREALNHAMSVTTMAASAAAGVVIEVMRSKSTPASVRLRAATAILEILLRWAELQDFDQRLKRMEERLGDLS